MVATVKAASGKEYAHEEIKKGTLMNLNIFIASNRPRKSAM